MPLRPLTVGMRAMLGAIGVIGIACAIAIVRWDASRLRAGASHLWGSVIVALMCVVAAGGLRLVNGAMRGRIHMRDNRRGIRGA